MNKTTTISLLALATLTSACPGTLDEESLYQGSSYSRSSSDAGLSEPDEPSDPEQPAQQEPTQGDAGWATRDAGATDASAGDASKPWPAMDASTSDASERWPSEAAVAEAGAPDSGKIGSDASSAAQEAGASCDFRALIMAKCGSAGCHGAGAVATGLDLTSDNLAARLGDRMGTGACSSYALIDRTTPERSAIYVKVTADACGSRMPLGGTLSDREQQCILQWIENL